ARRQTPAPERTRAVTECDRSAPNVKRSRRTGSSMTSVDDAGYLGTLSHLTLANADRLGLRQGLNFRRHLTPPRPFAIEGQAHRDGGAFLDAAADVETAAVQRHQSLDDGKAEAGPVERPRVRAARLEERIADARHVGRIDTDAGVDDSQRQACGLASRAHRDTAAAIGKLDGVGQEIDE